MKEYKENIDTFYKLKGEREAYIDIKILIATSGVLEDE